MSFLVYDITFLVIFTIFVVIFLYLKRKNLQREGPLFLYRTKVGLNAIESLSKKYKKQLNWIQYISIITGYILMIIMIYLFLQVVYIYLVQPDTVRAIKIPPIMPLVPYLPSMFNISFLPPFYFTYWILILAVVAIGHEFAHGIFARFHKIKVKSTGFGFLGPFLAAFVEPDEKEMEKRSIKEQLSILSAGTFANIILSIIFIIIFVIFFYTLFIPSGVIFNSYIFSEVNLSNINSINGINVSNPSTQIIFSNLNLSNENNWTKIRIDKKTYLIDNQLFISNINNTKEMAIVYEDLPAANLRLSGAIIEINNVKIKNPEELSIELKKHEPGDEIIVKTKLDGEIKTYQLNLGSNNAGEAYLGIGLLKPSNKGIKGKIYLFISMIRSPGIYYESIFNNDLTIFIQDLLWWMILINISVALVNMLPLGIFDGGKVFYLTALHFTKSEEISKKIFKFATWFLLSLIALIMIFWFFSIYSR